MKRKIFIIILIFVLSTIFFVYGAKFDVQQISKQVRKGEIDVGDIPDMEWGNRYHNIHNEVLGIDCTSCHVSSYAPDYLYQRKYKLPVRGMPGPVDRGICLGCHKTNGPAKTKLYGPVEE